MLIGVNFTSPKDYLTVQRLLKSGKADFFEILIDNFLHQDPRALKDHFAGIPVAFHIMNSRFLERGIPEKSGLAAKLREFIGVLNPIYVSDHLASFSHQSIDLPMLAELNYSDLREERLQLCRDWQESLGFPLLLENFPSMVPCPGRRNSQLSFFDELRSVTGILPLFDFSNAQIAELNGSEKAADWGPLLKDCRHFHAGGFRLSETVPVFAIDTHDTSLSSATLRQIQSVLSRRSDLSEITLVVERDANISADEWEKDLEKARELC